MRELGTPSSPSEIRTLAALLTGLGEFDQAFAVLERATTQRLIEPINLLGADLDPLRPDPRFAALLKRMRLAGETVDVFVRLPEVLAERSGPVQTH
jgi:hypothetical protein